MKKRVLFVINTPFDNAGVPHVIMTIVKGLSNDFVFDLLTYSSSEDHGDREAEFLSYGGQIYRFKTLDYTSHKLLFFLRKYQIRAHLKKILSQGNYDIVHCNNGIEAGIVLQTAKKMNVAVRISHAHGIYSRMGKNYLLRFYNWRNKRRILKFSTHSIACSESAGKSLFAGKPFINVLNPVDLSIYSTVRFRKHESINLLQIGYYCHNKNQMMSLKVLKSLIEKGINAKLSFVGFICDRPYFEELSLYIKENNLDGRVFFLDKDIDKREIFSDTDFLLLPSYSEGLSITTLEAQAAGVKCVVSDSVSMDCDCGLVRFINNENVSEWGSYIAMRDEIELKLDTEKMGKVDVSGYCCAIKKVYGHIAKLKIGD